MTKADIETFRARVWGTKNIFIHNDLSNVAFYYKNLIIKRTSENDNKGITFDHMSCLVFSAFSLEAYLNFFGVKLVKNWDKKGMERMNFPNKSKLIFETLGVKYDWSQEPFKSVDVLKSFRNTIAHGKPMVQEYDNIVELPQNELDRPYELTPEWEALCTHESTLAIYDAVEKIIRLMREASGLEPFDMLTHGHGSIQREV